MPRATPAGTRSPAHASSGSSGSGPGGSSGRQAGASSTTQAALQQSPPTRLPSSQASPSSRTPSPQMTSPPVSMETGTAALALDNAARVGQSEPMYLFLRIATAVLGVVFTLGGIGWLVDPAGSAAQLGMPLLDGVGRSTQIGDLSAFFVAGGVLMLLGNRLGHGRLLYLPACIIGGAAVGRVIAWAAHGAAFATQFIVVEVVVATILVLTARELDQSF